MLYCCVDVTSSVSSTRCHAQERFVELTQIDDRYFICDHERLKDSANAIQHANMNLSTRFQLAYAPVNTKLEVARSYYVKVRSD